MADEKNEDRCSICTKPIRWLKGKKCDVCGNRVCDNCYQEEKGIRAFIRRWNRLPTVLCYRCIFVRQSSDILSDKASTYQEDQQSWFSGLLCKGIFTVNTSG